MNPFDLKSVLLARHAQHVVLIHFPIALFLVSVAFDFAAQWWRSATLAAVSYYNLTVAAFSSVPVVATGLMAWHWQLEGQRLKGTLLLHLLLGLASTALIWLVWWLHFRGRKPERTLSLYRLPLEALAAAVVALTAHLGGFLSGVNAPV
ncbi:MAG TPA: DUF2231 domain-containing protein [Candidatus Acidoferrum sp.]|nr:DUF2231 domain-containing protein [Candidatus Acidoferrum sp.]